MSAPGHLLDQLEEQSLNAALTSYMKHDEWRILRGQELVGHLQRQGQLRYAPQGRPQDLYQKFEEALQQQPFWEIATDFFMHGTSLQKTKSDVSPLVYHSSSHLLWDFISYQYQQYLGLSETIEKLKATTSYSLTGWTMPTKDILLEFHDAAGNPARFGGDYRLYAANYWTHTNGVMDFGYRNMDVSRAGSTMAYLSMQGTEGIARWQALYLEGLKLAHRASNTLLEIPDFAVQPDTSWSQLDFAGLWQILRNQGLHLQAEDAPEVQIRPQYDATESLRNLDYTPCRLPRLEEAQFRDIKRGLWELQGEDLERLRKLDLQARDPALDLRDEWVAIDFGTSSTVVAINTPSGGKELLRVGVQDFNARPEPWHYENPTVLEFLDLNALLRVWNQEVYRPALNWDWLRAAHEARNDFRANAKSPRMVNSVLRTLKRWAVDGESHRVRIIDQSQGQEYELPGLRACFPVRGQLMEADPNGPLDPIELYAWFLGMAINWRQRGLYVKYALTFPVKYTEEIRSKIRASFERGLQRSLPWTLAQQSAILNRFQLLDISSEPTAYAVATLPLLGLQPSSEGLAYAVFDFGGGTTDFDFGLWRLPTPEEADLEGAESVFERKGSHGDPYLGGENLLAMLAYQLFVRNIDDVYDKKLTFTRPSFLPPAPGTEAAVEQSSIAEANSAMVMEALRPLLEDPDNFTESRLTVDLRNAQGDPASVTLELNPSEHGPELPEIIAQRVKEGVASFLSEMQAAFAQSLPGSIHILLAGNASRGKWVRESFDPESTHWQEEIRRVFGEREPELIIHPAVGAEEAGLNAPNCKTAVAWGALDLTPGQPILQKDPHRDAAEGDAPFGWFVGGYRQNQLQPVLQPGTAYGQWQELGAIRSGVFVLAWSASPRARSGNMAKGDPELRQRGLDFPMAHPGWRVFGRVVDANAIEVIASPEQNQLDERQAQRVEF